MKKNFLLLSAALVCSAGMYSSADDGKLTELLPAGVSANVDHEEKEYGPKTITIAGSAEKGYKAYFCADDGTHGEELWVSDGTPEGTKLVKDINPGLATSNINWITRFNDRVVFAADDGENGKEVWISDGTEAGTHMVADVHMLADSDPVGFCQLNENQFIFFAKDMDSETMTDAGEKWLYVSDGTEDGTHLVAEVDGMWLGREPGDNRFGTVVRVGRKVFFIGDTADKSQVTYGDELWVTDGTTEGTHMVKDINLEVNSNESATPGSTNGAAIAHFCNYYNEKLFFKAWSWESGNEPWATDGTEEGTYEIFNTNPTVSDNLDANGVPMGNGGGVTKTGYPAFGYVFFRSYTPETRDELGMTNCEKGNYKVFDCNTTEPTQDNSSYPDDGVEFDGYYVFCCNRGTNADIADPFQYGGELNVCDGDKTWVQYDFNPGTGCTWTRELIVVNGTLYWSNSGNKDNHNWTLTRLDKVDGGVPVTVTNIHPTDDQVYTLRNLDGKLVFFSNQTKQIYCYEYENPNKNLALNPDKMEIEFEPNNPLHNTGDGVEGIFNNDSNAPVEYYNLQGMRVDGKSAGLYIRRQGDKASKVIIK
ncbi:MAG: hypothetical protein HDS68_03990 [Bacteroidales bacterium]|nr:hypothetical protein [Bacteroidales bacterium]